MLNGKHFRGGWKQSEIELLNGFVKHNKVKSQFRCVPTFVSAGIFKTAPVPAGHHELVVLLVSQSQVLFSDISPLFPPVVSSW